MSDLQEMTPGEMGRSLARIESNIANLSNQMLGAIAPVAELKVKVESCREDINGLGSKLTILNDKVDAVKARADKASGAAALLAFLSGFLSWLVRH